MNNVRFATSIHILTVLAMSDELVSSEYISESVNVNSAIIRKEMGRLRDCGLIESREGKGGGSRLARPPKRIRLSEIYAAVKHIPILGRSNDPNPKCPIGKQMNKQIDDLYAEAEKTLIRTLDKMTLADFAEPFKKK
ncbi:MAG: RrF2 family transcriptional regulator [Bacteroidia bacterium]